MNVTIDDQGGIVPTTPGEKNRAKQSDLGTLPTNIKGTNCFNCRFLKGPQGNIGFCSHKKVNQPVSSRNCCAYWDNPDYLRHW